MKLWYIFLVDLTFYHRSGVNLLFLDAIELKMDENWIKLLESVTQGLTWSIQPFASEWLWWEGWGVPWNVRNYVPVRVDSLSGPAIWDLCSSWGRRDTWNYHKWDLFPFLETFLLLWEILETQPQLILMLGRDCRSIGDVLKEGQCHFQRSLIDLRPNTTLQHHL